MSCGSCKPRGICCTDLLWVALAPRALLHHTSAISTPQALVLLRLLVIQTSIKQQRIAVFLDNCALWLMWRAFYASCLQLLLVCF